MKLCYIYCASDMSSHDVRNWGQLFKINDVFSKRFVKISNDHNTNTPLFFIEKKKVRKDSHIFVE